MIRGKELQAYEFDLGMVREASRQYSVGIQFNCLTPGATVRIKSIKIAPSSAEVFFRKTFELAEKRLVFERYFAQRRGAVYA